MNSPQDLFLSLLKDYLDKNELVRRELSDLWVRVFFDARDYLVARTSEARERFSCSLWKLREAFFKIVDESCLSEEEKLQAKAFINQDLQTFMESVNSSILSFTDTNENRGD